MAAVTKPAGGARASNKKKPNSGGGSGGRRSRLVYGKCHIHRRYGTEAYSCADEGCSMRKQVKPKPKMAKIENNDD